MKTLPFGKCEKLVHDAEFSTAILANPATGEFELLETASLPVPEYRLQGLRQRGLFFCGAIGIVGGVPRMELEEPIDAATADAIGKAFLEHLGSDICARIAQNLLDRWFEQQLLPDGRAQA